METSLAHLPDEILYSILCYSPPRSSAALERTARRFRNVTNEPLLWRFYCLTHFNFWDKRHEFHKKLASPVSSVDWKKLYITRHLIDIATTEVLESILTSQTGRIEKFHTIVNFGYDAKDTLIRHSLAGPEKEDYLARRYYSNAVLACLHRSIAVPQWAKLRNGENISLERALGAFDLFIPESGFGDLDDITGKLDRIVAELVAENPDIESLTPRGRALAVASYLRRKNLTGIESGREYHSLEHNFLGIALSDPGHNSLPLISAAIYCYVSQSLGLNARPCGFPFHVHVIIMPPPGLDMDGNVLDDGSQGEPMYMDPFRSSTETPVSDLQSQLNFLGASDLEQSTYLGESLTSEIVLRCGKNILNSIQQMSHTPTLRQTSIDVVSAKYAGLWSSMLFAGPSRPMELRQHLPWLMELFATDFPSDIYLIEQYIVPLFQGLIEYEHLLESLHVMRAVDEIPKQVRRRTSEHKNVRYRIGQVFRHRRYNYIAVITGWDAECGAGEQWIRRMGVDRLRDGRHQSFYHVLVEDKSVRYVAEENIEIITPHISELPPSFTMVAGKHFKRWDEQSRTFVSNIRDEYPDD
ncbi:Hemimethylated DNA-binding protein YccV like-domain-containing protein [Thermoascus aurantiacus ATCC 26904]